MQSKLRKQNKLARWLATMGGVASWLIFQSFAVGVAGDRVYRCDEKGKITYSDSACVNAAVSTEVVTTGLNSFQSDKPLATASERRTTSTKQSVSSVVSSARARDGSIALDQQRAQLKCQRLADRLQTLEVKMRALHSGDQGERLREQRRQLEQQRRTEKCR